jgi:hypothetical protein
LDQRKQAARAFLALHEALARLEGVSVDIRAEVKLVLDGRRSYLWRAPFTSIAHEGDAASRAFADSLRELYSVISIYDPALAALLSGIRGVKQGLLIRVATVATSKMTFAVLPNPDGFAVHYSAPTERLMAADLEESCEIAQNLHQRARAGDSFEWPRDVLLSLVEDNLVEGRMADEDIAQARQLHEMLEKYTPFLAKARIEVEAFLRKNFSLEDLLYVKGKR